MKKGKNILTLLALSLLTACSSDELSSPTYTVGEADNAITLGAGIAEGGSGVMSRAVDGNHAGHTTLAQNTKMRLRVDGTWLGKTSYTLPHGSVTDTKATQTTTASVGAETPSGSKHNKVEFTPAEQLYWDDYGTADPANIDTDKGGTATNDTGGRGKGLTIYGVAVDKAGEAAPTVDGTTGKTWTALAWELPSNQTGGWAAKDLITSNNIKDGAGFDGTLKFDDTKQGSTTPPSNLLEFTHAMSKVTVVLTAGEGFDGYATNPATAKFIGAPTVTLKSFKYKGNVSIEGKTSTPDDAKADISMHLSDGGTGKHTATFDAIVFPGNSFENATEILTLTADGNTFKVTAKKLNDAIKEAITNITSYPATGTDTKLQQGWNYKIQITVNKTAIDVEATVVDWKTVTSADETPVIDVDKIYGHEGIAFGSNKSFSFLRSTTKATGYTKDAQMDYTKSPESYILTPQLYWPDHSTHYFFRATWPLIAETGTAGEYIPIDNFTGTNAIKIKNEKYNKDHYPSDLMLGYPRQSDHDIIGDEACKVGHKTGDNPTPGICATEGKIRMNFEYMMSQVEVRLTTATGTPTPADAVNLVNAKVEIVDGYTTGDIQLGDGASVVSGSRGTYTLDALAAGSAARDDIAAANIRHSAVVPQDLTYMDSDVKKYLRFKITIYKEGSTTEVDDIYYADIEPILKNGSTTEKIAPNGKWESGVHYIYTLDIRKTAITVNATITDWVTVKADQPIWF